MICFNKDVFYIAIRGMLAKLRAQEHPPKRRAGCVLRMHPALSALRWPPGTKLLRPLSQPKN